MSEFIEVHDKQGGAVMLNVANIMSVDNREDDCRIRMASTQAGGVPFGIATQETYDEVRDLLDCSVDDDPSFWAMVDHASNMRDAVQCLWSCMSDDLREEVRETYPDIAAVADEDFQSADDAQDEAIRDATKEAETDGN